MEIKKGAVLGGGKATPEQMEKINRLAKTPMTAEQVYVFSVRLCDDQADRDNERFDTGALDRLAELFVGKTGIADHQWSADRQVARIFETGVERDGAVSYIRAWAYVLRNEKNEPLIQEIEGGIKKEVSVGCAMGACRCSICGEEMGACQHRKGQEYGGQLCTGVLSEPRDAYEFSFVAVPAQKEAGVMKAWKGGEEAMDLEQYVAKEAGPEARKEYEGLLREASLGKAYLKKLRDRTVKLAMVLELGMEEPLLRKLTEQVRPEELEQLEAALEKKAELLFPAQCQLPGGPAEKAQALQSEFMI